MRKFILHLCNPGCPAHEQFKNIYSIEDLKDTLKENSTRYIFLINVHLTWKNQLLAENYGFDVAADLRMKFKCLNPFIFYSPLPLRYFYNLLKKGKNLKYQLLKAPGSTSYFSMPFELKELQREANNLFNIDELTRIDIITSLLNLRGLIMDRVNHDLKIDRDLTGLFNFCRSHFPNNLKVKLNLESELTKFSQLKSLNNGPEFDFQTEIFKKTINQYFGKKELSYQEIINTKYTILLIDDSEAELKFYTSQLSSMFNVIPIREAATAIEILKKDVKNTIKCVIFDWRLYQIDSIENEVKIWQNIQGYSLVVQGQMPNTYRKFIGLTSQDEIIQESIRNKFNTLVPIYSKGLLNTTDQLEIFSQSIFNYCKLVDEETSRIPTHVNWTKNQESLGLVEKNIGKGYEDLEDVYISKGRYYIKFPSYQHQYIDLLNNPDKEKILKNIDIQCDKSYDYLKSGFNQNGEYLNTMTIRNYIGIDISHKSNLVNLLILRRVWLAIHFILNKGIDYISVHKIMQAWPTVTDKTADQERRKLCFERSDLLNHKFFPEETAWLKTKGLI